MSSRNERNDDAICHKVSIGPHLLECGVELQEVEIAYEKAGNPIGEVIIVCHALTGNQKAVGTKGDPGWWRGFIGPGLYVDTDKFQVITMNVLGGCNGSTGPISINPTTGNWYGDEFPAITIRDMVHAQFKVLTKLGITRVRAILGGSLGGMQVLEWGLLYPNFAEVIIPIAVTPYFTDYALAYNAIGRHAIKADPAWEKGQYPIGTVIKGLEIARMVGLVTYRSDRLFNERFKRDRKEVGKDIEYQVDSYMKYQGEKFSRRFDANSYLSLLKAMDQYDIGYMRNGWKSALNQLEAKTCLISFKGDLLYPSTLIKEVSECMNILGKKVTHFEVDTMFGHDGFLVEFEKWGGVIKNLLEEKEVTQCLV
ncbi:homoserine O-acetyltransferase MetX [Sutcliffiella rhizosphaerae]|uniref:Homoserine O-acetyltransferase n=1 Tax=Sutcliffiella rhizosphaerae TaxID=2880967 RepID=A0ABN8A9N3_9BACI|nr:homoserine O-acetyltransferase [Sutcliffiella rhizosphaerae]CAG9620571.1 Homoserine O-acetyltransferase [Sutcliffiella rhizosphaerae]